MKECPDLDTVVALEEALGWEAESALRHILSCDECLAGVQQVERLHAALDRSVEPTPGFADRVLASLPKPPPAARSSRRANPAPFLSAGIFVLASVTALLMLGAATIASPAAGGLRPEMLVFAALVGFAAVKVTPRHA